MADVKQSRSEMIDDEEDSVLHRAISGDREAFASLVNKYGQPLRHAIFRRVGDATRAEELAKAASLRAFVAINAFPRHSMFLAWLYRMALAEVRKAEEADRGTASQGEPPVVATASHGGAAEASLPEKRPLFLQAADYFAEEEGVPAQAILEQAAREVLEVAYPGPECLTPPEVESLAGGEAESDALKDRAGAHMKTCPQCEALVEAARPERAEFEVLAAEIRALVPNAERSSPSPTAAPPVPSVPLAVFSEEPLISAAELERMDEAIERLKRVHEQAV